MNVCVHRKTKAFKDEMEEYKFPICLRDNKPCGILRAFWCSIREYLQARIKAGWREKLMAFSNRKATFAFAVLVLQPMNVIVFIIGNGAGRIAACISFILLGVWILAQIATRMTDKN